jgi:hypothetical protein
MLTEFPSPAERRPPSIAEVRVALALLRGRSRLIRSRLAAAPPPTHWAVTDTLDEIETQIDEICRQLETLEQAAFGPPY